MYWINKIAFVSVVGLAAGCDNSGANYTPVIDGTSNPNYSADLAECQTLAASGATIDGRAVGAAATGAAVAGASSVIWNGNSSNAGEAAAIGALAGVTSSAIRKNAERENIVKNCMRGRGYNVLG